MSHTLHMNKVTVLQLVNSFCLRPLQVNDSSPKTVLSQLCELLAARPLQGLVYEEERPPRTAWGPLAPMLEFVSAQTGLPIVAVGGGAGLGRMPQV